MKAQVDFINGIYESFAVIEFEIKIRPIFLKGRRGGGAEGALASPLFLPIIIFKKNKKNFIP